MLRITKARFEHKPWDMRALKKHKRFEPKVGSG
jgi:hypothetical protein